MAESVFAKGAGFGVSSSVPAPPNDLDALVKGYLVTFNAENILEALSRKTSFGGVQYQDGIIKANYEQDVNRLTALGDKKNLLMSPWMSVAGKAIKPSNLPRGINLLLDDGSGDPKKYDVDTRTDSAMVLVSDLRRRVFTAKISYV